MECRLCLSTAVSKNIFELKYAILQPFLYLLKIKKDDGLSNMVCYRCINKISPMETFYKKCKEVDLYLHSKQSECLEVDKTQQKTAVLDEQESSDEDKSLFDIFFKNEHPSNSVTLKNKRRTNKTTAIVKNDLKKEQVLQQNQRKHSVSNKLSLTDKILATSKLKNCDNLNVVKSEDKPLFIDEIHEDKKTDMKCKNITLKIEYDEKHESSDDGDIENKFESNDDCNDEQSVENNNQMSNTDINMRQKRQPLKLFCPACNLKLLSIPLYVKHVRTHKGVLTCKICAFPFITKQKLRIHTLKIHYCTHCRKYFKDKRPHERMEHDNSFIPIFPEEKIVTEKKAPEVNLCPICGTIVKSSIVKHMETHSNASFKCNVCPKAFVTKFRLQQHTKIHYSQRNFECDYCGSKFTSRHTLILHIKGVHLKSYTTSCPICGKVFSGRGYVKEHIKRHMGDKRFLCNICSDSFVNARSLRDHITKHTTDRPYICAYCPKAFKTKEGCKRHEKIHKGVTPHKCPICFKGFIQRANMKSHFKYNHKGLDFEKEDAQYKMMNQCYYSDVVEKT